MKTRNTLIALAVAASALTGVAATATQASTVAIAWHDNDSRGDGRWDNRGNDHRNGGWDNRGGHEDRRFAIENRIHNLRERIQDGRRNGSLSRREAYRLENRLNDIASLKRSYEYSGYGINGQEAATLDARLDDLSGQLRWQRHDGNRW
ncbi:MAG: hypothetical protein JF615_07790 [Asticcacaulis sp.]|nr:hypothetical protein [Asticcacaulis sp.]